MKHLCLFLSVLSLWSVPAARAEVLESNVTLAYRLHAGHLQETRGQVQTESYSTVSFHTVDVIHQIGLKTKNDFSPRARLIYQTRIYSEGASESFYLIRDPFLGDFNATAFFEKIHHEISIKSRYKKDNTGTRQSVGHLSFNIQIKDITEGLYGSGPANIQVRTLHSRQFPGSFLEPTTSRFTTYGHYKLAAQSRINTGYAIGTIRHHAPKITLTPTES